MNRSFVKERLEKPMVYNKFYQNRYFRVGFILFFSASALWFACSGTENVRHITAKELAERFDLRELTPLEIKRVEAVLNSQVSPCGDDVTLAEALYNPEHCPLAPLAGRFVMQQVMADYNAEEIAEAYLSRYAAVKGLEIAEDGSPRMGPVNPVATLVIFTDFECPFCGKAADWVHKLMRRHSKELALVHKNYPLAAIHPNSEIQAKAGFAAHRQGKFWEMHDVIYSASGTMVNRERLFVFAKGIGLDMEKFEEDLDSEAAVTALEVDRRLGQELGVEGTPTFFLNGRRVENGLKGLDTRLQEELLRNNRN